MADTRREGKESWHDSRALQLAINSFYCCMTVISSKSRKASRPEQPTSMAKPTSLLSRIATTFFLLAALASLSLILLIHAWTPPIEHVINMASLFHHGTDPNNIDGRIPVGYWEDDGPKSAQAAVDESWGPEEREMVMNYLKLASSPSDNKDIPRVLQEWRGLSFCRFCEENTGNSCMGDKDYNWPQGYLHYIEHHHVKPPQKFINHVRKQMELLNK